MYALPSIARTRPLRRRAAISTPRPNRDARLRAASLPRSKPQGATTIASGSATAIASQSSRCEFASGIRQEWAFRRRARSVRNPVTRAHRRIGPLEHERARTLRATPSRLQGATTRDVKTRDSS